jgi:hypothetical protein
MSRWITNVGWLAGDCDSLANDDARDGAADAAYYRLQRERDEAHLRANRWEKLADHWRHVAAQLLCEPVRSIDTECMKTGAPEWAVNRAVVYARCAARVSEWARQARSRSCG